MISKVEEWVLLPGATFVVQSVKKIARELPEGQEWYEVQLKQVK